MSGYADKLSSLSEKKQKLLDEESRLIVKRKKEIGDLAEKFGLLTVSDKLIAGIFADARNAIINQSSKIQEWEKQSELSVKTKRNSKATEESAA